MVEIPKCPIGNDEGNIYVQFYKHAMCNILPCSH